MRYGGEASNKHDITILVGGKGMRILEADARCWVWRLGAVWFGEDGGEVVEGVGEAEWRVAAAVGVSC